MSELFIPPVYQEVFQYMQFGRLHHLALGGGDSGKTNFWMWFLKYLPKKYRVVIVNSMNHIEFKDTSDITINESQIHNLQDGLNKTNSDGGYKHHIVNLKFSDSLRANHKDMEQVFDELCREIFHYEDELYTRYMWAKYKQKIDKDFLRQARIIIIVDELLDFVEQEKIQPHHLQIIREGRNYGIIHIGNSQRSQWMSKWILTHSRTKYLFEIDQYDIHKLSGKIQGIEEVKNLNPYNFIVVHGSSKFKRNYYKPCPLIRREHQEIEEYEK